MKIIKILLSISLLWGALVTSVLVFLHLSNGYLVVNIHWKSNSTGALHTAPFSPAKVINIRREQPHKLYKSLPPQWTSHKTCTDVLCTEHLDELELKYFNQCKEKTEANAAKFGPLIDTGDCVFQNSTGRLPVGLASFPGSGNTWVRGLLQKLTGYCTGALYCDGALRTGGFSGEGIRGPSALVIKAHSKNALFSNQKLPRRILNDNPVYGAAILLVRNPRDALVAEWNRERTKRQTNITTSNHYLYVGQEYFGTNENWSKYVEERMARWKAHISGWIISGRLNPFLVVQYENLKQNTSRELLKMVEFLGFQEFTIDSLEAKLGSGYDSFYRNHKDDFEHFTESQLALVNNTVQETIAMLAKSGLENIFPIKNYLL